MALGNYCLEMQGKLKKKYNPWKSDYTHSTHRQNHIDNFSNTSNMDQGRFSFDMWKKLQKGLWSSSVLDILAIRYCDTTSVKKRKGMSSDVSQFTFHSCIRSQLGHPKQT